MWLYVPNTSTSSPSAPEEADSISASSWQFKALEASVWWRGKPSQSRHWYQRWSKASFIQLLCGRMPEASTAVHGVAQWTASLAASRASLTALLEGSAEAWTPATCGLMPAGSSSSRVHGSPSSRMSAACSRRGLMKSLEPNGYGETFASLVSRLRSDCSRRRKSAQAMSASASSSSPSKTWATPQARDHMPPHSQERIAAMKAEGHGMRNLNDEAATWSPPKWPTPAVTDSFGARNRTSGRSDPNSKHHDGVTLNDAIVLWSTPTQVHRKSEKAMRPFAEGGQSSPPAIEQQAEVLVCSLPVPTTYPVGGIPSPDRRSLNPLFVEWLMGWPPGWTLLAWTDFACSATELSLFKQRMRSALLSLGLPREAPPAQLALFG
jgi:hypothetical protein